VVIYIRRQDELMLSAWQQWYAKVSADVWDDFWGWVITHVGWFGNWQTILEQWEQVFGRERIRVRLYEPDRLIDGDSVADFRQFLSTEVLSSVPTTETLTNPSVIEAIADLVPRGGLFRDAHDDRFYAFMERMLGADARRMKDESSITYRQRLALLRRYEESNAWVRDMYFAEANVPPSLFRMPTPRDYVVKSREELTHEQIQLLMRVVFQLARSLEERDAKISPPGGNDPA
jgi:hypothetical protein